MRRIDGERFDHPVFIFVIAATKCSMTTQFKRSNSVEVLTKGNLFVISRYTN